MLLNSKKVDIGVYAKDFELKNVDNEIYTLNDIKKRNGFVIAFICNHCPFVKHVNDEVVNLTNEIIQDGIGVIGINSNDSSQEKYAEDSIDKMREYADSLGYNFPYVVDEDQLSLIHI